MSDSIDIMNKIWQTLIDNGLKSFEYKSDESGESIKAVFDDAPHQELQLYSILKQQTKEAERQ